MSPEKDIDKAAKNARDSINEVKHRIEADEEKYERENDPTMSQGDRAKSVVNETKRNIQADIDKGKRDARNDT